MLEQTYFNDEEKAIVLARTKELLGKVKGLVSSSDIRLVHTLIKEGIANGKYQRDQFGFNPVVRNLETSLLIVKHIAPDRNMVISFLLHNLCDGEQLNDKNITKTFGEDVAKLVRGLNKVSKLYEKQAAVMDENFHKLLLTFADDIRVIIMMIVDRLQMMYVINHHPNEELVSEISNEARYLYAPLAHRLGLYRIKQDLEDLSLKYLNRGIYTQIAHKLNETKTARDKYIEDFIRPIKERMDATGIKYYIKGRTKSINSIWNKMQKQGVDLDGMYDLFAIRIIIDTPREKEKRDCWIAYSEVTDIYRANTSRLKDWITIPKTNGYESLHITVYGPNEQWVEVQIRTKRMDEVAERGLAAHWRYKGIKGEDNLDSWMNNVRDVLEAGSNGPMELIKSMKMNIYEKEVFVFSPKGDLYKFPLGATILDFAFHIHSKLGCSCVGGIVDGKNQKINYKLKSGDTVEIVTSSQQMPRLDWLNFVVTSKARNKIKQQVNEMRARDAELAKELVQRRFKNRKIEMDDAVLMRLIKKMGFKTATDFFIAIGRDNIDVNYIVERYLELDRHEKDTDTKKESAQNFVLQTNIKEDADTDVLVIGDNIKGINYKLSKCCNPIFGDRIVGFVASDGAIKIHRQDCNNAIHLISRYPYREIKTAWSGKLGAQFAVNLRIVGQDDIGIVTNITSVINKEKDTTLRSISIDSHDGLFQGILVIGVSNIDSLNDLIRKIQNLKGVKDVQRTNN